MLRQACIGTTRGLWRDPERDIEKYWSRIPDIWVHGDWASHDADGSWLFHGRSDDTIKIAGKRTGRAEIEALQLLFVRDLPRTRNLKTMRRVIRAVLLAGEPGDLPAPINPEAVEKLKKIVAAPQK